MEKVNRVESCFAVDKFHKMKSKEDEAVKKFIIDDLSKRVAEHLADILSSEAQPEPRWIPVTEKLPEDGRYLCTYEDDEHICVDIGRVVDGEWNDWYVMPTAWMPLPEPYREETEDATN